MNPDPKEIESLLKTPETLPLNPRRVAASRPTPDDEATEEAEAVADAAATAPEEEGDADSTSAQLESSEAAVPVEADEPVSTDVAAQEDGGDAADAPKIVVAMTHIAEVTEEEEQAPPEPEEAPAAPQKPLVTLRFSPAPDGPFQSSLTLGLECSSPTAQIRYALGAATVDDHGILYDPKDKIFLTQTTLVTARVFENGEAGEPISAKFEINKPQWLELEPTDQTDATPHKLSDVHVTPAGWQLAVGSVRGKLHAHRALWREDSFALGHVEAGSGSWSVIAVSDGAGSAPLSRVGSRVACDGALASLQGSLGEIKELAAQQDELITQNLPALREALVKCGTAALDGIRQEAQTRGKPLTAFASTLLVLAWREWNGAQLCGALQVGDGSIALFGESGLTLLGEADHGQHSSETRFLTTNGVEAELASRVKFSIKNDLTALAVMSDGVSDDYFPEDKRLGEVFEAVLPLLEEDDAGAALVEWLGYEKKGSSDDRTLVVGRPIVPHQTEDTDVKLQAADGHAG